MRLIRNGFREQVLKITRAPEQHFTLVGEVPEEGPLSEPGTLGDVGDRGRFETTLAVELQCCLLQAAQRVRLPSTRDGILLDDRF
jgi:hypothetical protein